MSNGEDGATIARQRYRRRFVAAALGCAWLAVISPAVGTGLMLLIDDSRSAAVLMLPIITLMFLAVPASIAIVVLSIMGGMWNRWVDGIITAAILSITLGADLMFWPLAASQTNFDFTSVGSCMAGSGCVGTGSDTDIWIGVGVQIMILVLLFVCTSYWMWRLNPVAADRRSQTFGLIALGLASAAILAAIDLNIPTSRTLDASVDRSSNFGWFSYSPLTATSSPLNPTSPGGPSGGHTTLINDLGRTVRVVYCPLQNCTGQAAHTMSPGAASSFPDMSTAAVRDSFVILGGTPVCQTVNGPGDNMTPLSSGDTQECGADVDSLTVH